MKFDSCYSIKLLVLKLNIGTVSVCTLLTLYFIFIYICVCSASEQIDHPTVAMIQTNSQLMLMRKSDLYDGENWKSLLGICRLKFTINRVNVFVDISQLFFAILGIRSKRCECFYLATCLILLEYFFVLYIFRNLVNCFHIIKIDLQFSCGLLSNHLIQLIQ